MDENTDASWRWAYDQTGDRRHDEVFGGKWMLAFALKYADDTWKTIARAAGQGRLGARAKVPTDPAPGRPTRIFVYTADYRDIDDVLRVLTRVRELGFPRATLSYKEDAATRAEARIGYFKYGALYVAPRGKISLVQKRDPVVD